MENHGPWSRMNVSRSREKWTLQRAASKYWSVPFLELALATAIPFTAFRSENPLSGCIKTISMTLKSSLEPLVKIELYQSSSSCTIPTTFLWLLVTELPDLLSPLRKYQELSWYNFENRKMDRKWRCCSRRWADQRKKKSGLNWWRWSLYYFLSIHHSETSSSRVTEHFFPLNGSLDTFFNTFDTCPCLSLSRFLVWYHRFGTSTFLILQ